MVERLVKDLAIEEALQIELKSTLSHNNPIFCVLGFVCSKTPKKQPDARNAAPDHKSTPMIQQHQHKGKSRHQQPVPYCLHKNLY